MAQGATIERYLDRLYEAELHLVTLAHAEEYLEAQATRRQQQALSALSKLPLAERERLTSLLGSPEGKQLLSEKPAEQLLLDAIELSAFHAESVGTLEGELKELAGHARDAVRNAARHTGRERTDDLNDAYNLLSTALKNPIAARNPALWFEMGWTLWQQGKIAEAEDAFYQAVRLSSGSNERFVRHALRHLSLLLAAQGKGDDAYQSAQRFVSGDSDDPQLFLEAARYAALAGQLPEAGKLVGKALEADPTYIGALFAEPDLAPLGEARIQALEQITRNARMETEHQTARWQRAGSQLTAIEELLGRTIPLPPEFTPPGRVSIDDLSLFAARRMAWRNGQQADLILDEARGHLQDAIKETEVDEERLRRRIELAHSEKRRWEMELAAVMEDAERGKFPLHPYNWENPLTPRRNAQAKYIREVYTSCKANLEQSERIIVEQMPEMEERRRSAQERLIRLRTVLDELDAPPATML
jgi:tetratricopeptide (TPR) repeat protein